MEFSAAKIAQWIEGEIVGDENIAVSKLAKIEDADKNAITFLGNEKYLEYLTITKAGIVIINKTFSPHFQPDATYIVVDDAYSALNKLLKLYQSLQTKKVGKEPNVHISENVSLGENLYLGAFSYLGNNVSVGNNSSIYPQVYIGDNVTIGENTIIYPGAKIYHDCKIGNNCIVHAGAVIGSDGFGFNYNKEKNHFEKVPQVGNVVLEDFVEIGANTTIDRATMGSTIIKKGVKLDNLIQIAHNVEIGGNSVIASQTGIAGSTKIGQNAMIGGQVGITGHLKIGNRVQIQAQSGVNQSIEDDTQLYGSPAMKANEFRKSYVFFRKFPEIVEKINNLEKLLKNK